MKDDITEDAITLLENEYLNTVTDESNDKKYFIITPRIVKAFARNPYDFSLWDTVKDIAGENGECYLATPELASLSRMSVGQVSSSRKYWIKIGFLRGSVRRDPGYPQPVWHLTVPDLWAKNIAWCEKHPKISDRIAFIESLHHVKPSPGEKGTPPGELKNTTEDLSTNINKRAALLAKLYQDNCTLITPIMAQTLADAAVEFPEESWYEPAFKIAVERNARNWRFISTILTNWKEKGRDWTPDQKGKPVANRTSNNGQNLAAALSNVNFEE